MPHTTDDLWTVARWRELEPREGEKFEVIEGELVVTGIPHRRHARAVEELALLVAEFVRERGIGELYRYLAPVFINDFNVYLPDFLVFRAGAAWEAEWEELGTPMLAVEVLSPSTAKYDRGAKRQRYQGAGVDEYWIVDLDARLVERWRPGDALPEVLRDLLTWQPPGTAEPLTVDLRAYFARVVGA
ncbi:MAG: Uma2 family endonuclease [Gemmatimonadetes bacterium]|nr:Uma2 family endonuclease [Gemmatimonadota bacterium]